MRNASLVLALLLSTTACLDVTDVPEHEPLPEPEAPRCEEAPDWAAKMNFKIAGCGPDWDEAECPVCHVYLLLEGGEFFPLTIPGGLCTQVPYCAELFASGEPDPAPEPQ